MIPKAELHCHLEGSVPPVLARELAARNGLELPHGLFGANGHYAWTDFLSFLDSYDRVCGVLRKPRDFGDILYSYLQRSAAEGAVYVEMFCSPERPKSLGIPYATWLGALVDAVDRAKHDFGIEARLIAICIRHLGPDRALALAQQVVAEPHPYVVALGMGGDEGKFAPAEFAPIILFVPANTGMNGSWIMPVLLAALAVMLITALSWPIVALTRRRYNYRPVIARRPLMLYRATRLTAWLMVIVAGGWMAMIAALTNDVGNFDGRLDIWMRLVQLLSLAAIIGTALAFWNAWTIATGAEKRRLATIWAVVIAVSALFLVWMMFDMRTLTPSLNF